ncbi:hypothetical protein OK016_02100 [Vibrio chagasii]|nr:hypothetical protein [Vibrio chagasii]
MTSAVNNIIALIERSEDLALHHMPIHKLKGGQCQCSNGYPSRFENKPEIEELATNIRDTARELKSSTKMPAMWAQSPARFKALPSKPICWP